MNMALPIQKVEHIKPPRWFGRPALWKKIMKTLTLTRNAVVMFLTCIIAYLWTDPPFALTGDVKKGFPDVGVPQLRLYDQNSNSTERMTFTETLEFVGTGPVMVALVAILQNVAISKAFGHGQSVDGTQEMISLGATNTIGKYLFVATQGSRPLHRKCNFCNCFNRWFLELCTDDGIIYAFSIK